MSSCYLYVVARDFGFAPNPFHGVCSLATCKPGIRKSARVGDWVVGMGGRRLRATSRCLFAMMVTDAKTFDEYWADPEFHGKRPVRNGSSKMIVGDNIYHRSTSGSWVQADSHHSNVDGSPNPHNVAHDTQTDRVLLSHQFYYFGAAAPIVPVDILEALGYTNVRNYRRIALANARPLIEWLGESHGTDLNSVAGDPFDFDESALRYSTQDDKIR